MSESPITFWARGLDAAAGQVRTCGHRHADETAAMSCAAELEDLHGHDFTVRREDWSGISEYRYDEATRLSGWVTLDRVQRIGAIEESARLRRRA